MYMCLLNCFRVRKPLRGVYCRHLCTPCRSAYSNNHYFKYADDTALVGLLSDDETDYRSDIDHFVSWCVANCLELNVVKTKELVIDFRSGVYHPTRQHQWAKHRNCAFL